MKEESRRAEREGTIGEERIGKGKIEGKRAGRKGHRRRENKRENDRVKKRVLMENAVEGRN